MRLRHSARHKHNTILAIVVILLVLLVGGAAGYAFWTLRKRREARREQIEATLPTQFRSTPAVLDMREAFSQEEPLPAQAQAPGRWRVGSNDEKRSAAMRDVEAPQYREVVSAPLASGSRLADATLSPPSSARPQLPRIQTTATSLRDKKERPPARYLDSATVVPSSAESSTALPSTEPGTTLVSGATSGPCRGRTLRRSLRSPFASRRGTQAPRGPLAHRLFPRRLRAPQRGWRGTRQLGRVR